MIRFRGQGLLNGLRWSSKTMRQTCLVSLCLLIGIKSQAGFFDPFYWSNRIANGSFEYGDPGWTFQRGASIVGPRPGTPIGTEGRRVARLDADRIPGSISQELVLQESSQYRLVFDWAIDAEAGKDGTLEIRATGFDSRSFGIWSVTNRSVRGLVIATNDFRREMIAFYVPIGHGNVSLSFSNLSLPDESTALFLDRIWVSGPEVSAIHEDYYPYRSAALTKQIALSETEKNLSVEYTDSLQARDWISLTNTVSLRGTNLTADLGATRNLSRFYRGVGGFGSRLGIQLIDCLRIEPPRREFMVLVESLESVYDRAGRWIPLDHILGRATDSPVFIPIDPDRFYRTTVIMFAP